MADMLHDPVCGNLVDRQATEQQGLVSEYQGQKYFFANQDCKAAFDRDPGRFARPHV